MMINEHEDETTGDRESVNVCVCVKNEEGQKIWGNERERWGRGGYGEEEK